MVYNNNYVIYCAAVVSQDIGIYLDTQYKHLIKYDRIK